MSSEYKSFYHLELFKWLLFTLMGITFTRGVWALKVLDFNICNRKLHIFYIIQWSIWRQRIELGVWIWRSGSSIFDLEKELEEKWSVHFFFKIQLCWIPCSNLWQRIELGVRILEKSWEAKRTDTFSSSSSSSCGQSDAQFVGQNWIGCWNSGTKVAHFHHYHHHLVVNLMLNLWERIELGVWIWDKQ